MLILLEYTSLYFFQFIFQSTAISFVFLKPSPVSSSFSMLLTKPIRWQVARLGSKGGLLRQQSAKVPGFSVLRATDQWWRGCRSTLLYLVSGLGQESLNQSVACDMARRSPPRIHHLVSSAGSISYFSLAAL